MPSTLAHTQSHYTHYTRHSTFTQRIHLCTRIFGKLSIHTHTNIHTHTHAQKTIEAKCPKRNITNVFFLTLIAFELLSPWIMNHSPTVLLPLPFIPIPIGSTDTDQNQNSGTSRLDVVYFTHSSKTKVCTYQIV